MIEFDLSEDLYEVYEPEETYSINRELNLAWEIVEETGDNLFLTGKAGTGKTTFLKKLRENSSKNMVVLAPTGVAAINASGTTLHSFFQLPFSPYLPGKGFISEDRKYLNVSKQKRRLISSLSLIVIDEISMVRPDTLDAIDSMLRRLRNSTRPFGGVQLLLIGDLRQLPPVVKPAEWDMLKEFYQSPYFFESHALKNAGYQTIELSHIYRQNDAEFIGILNKVRDGKIDSETLNLLNKRYVPNLENKEMEGYIRLTTHNNRASVINELRLERLPGSDFIFEAEIKGNFPESAYPAEKTLVLKEGAQVMFIKNDTGLDRRFYNGMLGVVELISDDKIAVRSNETGELIEVNRMEWENTQYTIDEKSLELKQETVGTFSQYPLQLAWAITIHKSQGLTFNKAIIDASYSFAAGQTYVALSRCRNLDGLILSSPIPSHAVITDREVNDFVKYCESNAPDEQKVNLLKRQYLWHCLQELLDYDRIRIAYNDYCRYLLEYIVPLHPQLEKEICKMSLTLENDVYSVAKKFIHTCANKNIEEELKVPHSKLGERIRKSCEYFYDKLGVLKNFIDSLPKNIENRTFAERLNNTHESLMNLLEMKISILRQMSVVDFNISSYLKAKSKASLSGSATKQTNIFKKISEKRVKTITEKRPKGYSVFETLKLFKEGKSPVEIAQERHLSENTVIGHLFSLLSMDRIRREELFDEIQLEEIKKAKMENPLLNFTELYNKLNNGREDNPVPLIAFKYVWSEL